MNISEKEGKLVGILNRAIGFNGLEKAITGHPVYEKDGYYVIYFKINNSKEITPHKWYKEKLESCIDFIK